MLHQGSRRALLALVAFPLGIALGAACASATADDSPVATVVTAVDAGAHDADASHSSAATGTGGAISFPEAGAAGEAGEGGSSAQAGSTSPGGSVAAGGQAQGAGGSPAAGGSTAAGGSPAVGGPGAGGSPGVGGSTGPGTGGGSSGSTTGPCAGMPDQSVCAPTSDPCQLPGLCFSGVCQPIEPQSDDTPCGTSTDPCKGDSVCKSGVCTAPKQPDGTVCNDPGNACVQPGTCSGGVCGAPAPYPDAHSSNPADPFARCCGGKPTQVTSDGNCGGCGITCNAGNGESCQARTNGGQTNYYCAGCVASAKCWSGCCSTSYPATMNVCAVSDCAGGCKDICPTGQHCMAGASVMMSNWCAY